MRLLVSLAETLFGMDSPEFIGKVEEKRITHKLGWVSFCGREGKLIQNAYISSSFETCQVYRLKIFRS